jgi:DNA-binding Lrp family transcriptional regulator
MTLVGDGYPPNLDDLDLRLIGFLERDGRMAFSQLAKELGVSEATIHAHVNKMEQRGIIKGFSAIIDPEKLGLSICSIILIMAEPKRLDHVFSRLREMDEIAELFDVTGSYYGVAKAWTRSQQELGRLLDKIGQLEGVVSTNTLIVLRKYKDESGIRLKL